MQGANQKPDNMQKDNIFHCSLCEKASFDHNKNDENDNFIICEACEEDRFKKIKQEYQTECIVCHEEGCFFVKQPRCEHVLCATCCRNIYLGYLPKYMNEKTSFFTDFLINGKNDFPQEHINRYEEYMEWFEENDIGNAGNEWYYSQHGKYTVRKGRPDWMNHKDIIEYEDRLIRSIIIDNMNFEIKNELDVMKEKMQTKRCPLCRVIS